MSPSNETELELSGRERRQLLQLARQAITCAAAGTRPQQPADPGARLSSPAAVFVSLHSSGVLRGCIGQVVAREPLYRAVIDAATSAALYDPRFPPLAAHEVNRVDIEISVLSPMQLMDSETAEREIVIGRHGLMVAKEKNRGLLLPQVPTHFGWDARRFLEETCRKAGLAGNAWRQGARLYAFTAQVFSEESEAITGPEAVRSDYSNST